MGTFEKAIGISSTLVIFVIVPWGVIFYPAWLQRLMGDYTALNLLKTQGFHWIGAFMGLIIVLILIAGMILE